MAKSTDSSRDSAMKYALPLLASTLTRWERRPPSISAETGSGKPPSIAVRLAGASAFLVATAGSDYRFQNRLGDVEVRVDVLDVVCLFEALDEADHRSGRGLVPDRDRRLRNHRKLGGLDGVSRSLDRLA